ncbi:MAG: site-specific integrase [Candidatus Phlomobacter fragariae]
MKTRGLREKTLKDYKSKLLAIRKEFIDSPIENISTKNSSDFIQTYISDKKISMAKNKNHVEGYI